MAKKKASQICIVTTIGDDQVGIVAKLASVMARANINIIDVEQKVFDETFVMTMAVDIAQADIDLEKFRKRLDRVGKDMSLKITMQHEHIFKAMHRI